MLPIVITDDPGGEVAERALEVGRLLASGRPVVIAGRCASACTLYLALDQICRTDRAVLQFHAPSNPALVPAFLSIYPPGVRAWIAAHGGLGARVLTMPAAEVARYVKLCPSRG